MDYFGEITRIQVMHHNLTHETIPFRSTGVLTVRLTDSATAHHRVPGEACPMAAWRSGTTTQTRMAPAFPSPFTTTGSDSLTLTRLP
jgi:hypothetical protein